MPSATGAMMKHEFRHRSFTIGIEEELMLVDPETLDLVQGIEQILADEACSSGPGEVKPELMQSVLEVATAPCDSLEEARGQLVDLRARVAGAAARNGMAVGAAGTHPTADWRDQAITNRDRYRELVDQLSWIARQELLFGTHVHVGISDPDEAIYVADGIRRHLPLLLALSVNSPIWEREVTGMTSSRTPIFRQFPRIGIPPHYGDWDTYERRVGLMMRAGSVPDYTYLWWDVRPHPNLGTVEVRIFDQQSHVDETVALAAVTLCLAHSYSGRYRDGRPMLVAPTELIDDSKIRVALRGPEAEVADLERECPARAGDLATEMIDGLVGDAEALGCGEELDRARRFLQDDGTGAARQLRILEREGLDGVARAAILEG